MRKQVMLVVCLLSGVPLMCLGMVLLLGSIAWPDSVANILLRDCAGMAAFVLGLLTYRYALRAR